MDPAQGAKPPPKHASFSAHHSNPCSPRSADGSSPHAEPRLSDVGSPGDVSHLYAIGLTVASSAPGLADFVCSYSITPPSSLLDVAILGCCNQALVTARGRPHEVSLSCPFMCCPAAVAETILAAPNPMMHMSSAGSTSPSMFQPFPPLPKSPFASPCGSPKGADTCHPTLGHHQGSGPCSGKCRANGKGTRAPLCSSSCFLTVSSPGAFCTESVIAEISRHAKEELLGTMS